MSRKGAAKHINGYVAIKELLDKCHNRRDNIWHTSSKEEIPQPVTAKFPLFLSEKSTPNIFISYSHYDSVFVTRLASDLIKHGLEIWIDKNAIPIGGCFPKEIENGIVKADAMILFVSKSSQISGWVKEEHMAAIRRSNDDSSFILIPILIEECSPGPFISNRIWVDMRDQDSYDSGLNKILKRLLEKY